MEGGREVMSVRQSVGLREGQEILRCLRRLFGGTEVMGRHSDERIEKEAHVAARIEHAGRSDNARWSRQEGMVDWSASTPPGSPTTPDNVPSRMPGLRNGMLSGNDPVNERGD
jgi:hypothetical protein